MRLDTLITDQPTTTRCSMGAAMARIAATDEELYVDLTEWLEGRRGESDRQVWQALQSLDYRVGQQQIGHHRRGTCGCPR